MSDTKTSEGRQKSESVMSEMQRVEDILKDSLHRVNEIERKLQTKLLTLENRERLERELEDVKEVLKKNKERLYNLRSENTRTFMVVAALVFACFLVYGLYCIIYNVR